jgi:hypothetical protein
MQQRRLLTDCLPALVLSPGHRERRADTLQSKKMILAEWKKSKFVNFRSYGNNSTQLF